MLFSSYEFLFFFLPSILFIYHILLKKTRKGRNLFLTLASLFFYAWGEPAFVAVMIISILSNWLFALGVNKYRASQRKVYIILVVMLLFNLGVLCIFKYLCFALTNINAIFAAKFSIPQIMLPLGISFFTFQAISYVIDVYRQRGEVQRNPLNVALYISFFPQLIAGPIVRYETVAHQINNRRETWDDFCAGSTRFIIGLGKKMIIANNLALLADAAFDTSGEISVTMAWLGALAYTFQIYYDFSAYSDMAIGLGRMFGFKFLENFNYPYISSSITEFWRRWHISLGTWFRDYVYIPLGGNRVNSRIHLIFNLFIVWLLTGIWHGASWNFIIWGLLYFVLLIFEKFFKIDKRLSIFSYLTTFFLVMLGWIIFRATDISKAWEYIKALIGANGNEIYDGMSNFYLNNHLGVLVLATIFVFPVVPYLQRRFSRYTIYNLLYTCALLMILLSSISFIFKGGNNPFIYSNF